MQLEDEGCPGLPGFTSTVAGLARRQGLNRDGKAHDRRQGLLARALSMKWILTAPVCRRLRGISNVIVRKIKKLAKAGDAAMSLPWHAGLCSADP